MHFSTTVVALLPMLTSATFNISEPGFPEIDLKSINVTYSEPTLEQLHAAFPDRTFHKHDGKLEVRSKATNVTVDASTAGYRFGAGTLAMAGYYSLGPGTNQVQEAIDACKDQDGGSSATCVNKALSAAVAHIIVGGAGLTGGKQFIMYFWNAAAEQAQQVIQGGSSRLVKRASCSTQLADFSTTVRFSGTNGLKIAGKDFCHYPDSDELGYVQALGSHLESGFANNDALMTDFTIFETSGGSVLARYHAELDSTTQDLCPVTISGDGCTCSGC